MVKDLTQGKPFKILFAFTLPMLLSLLFQQLYNIVDSVIAGNAIGVDALAAVGASFPVTMLFIAIATGSGIGCSVVVSQLFGGKRFGELKAAISTAIISLTAIGIILTVVGKLICRPILTLMDTPADIFESAVIYLDIYIYGILFLFLYNTANAIFTALGDSKTPLMFLIFSSLLNIGLDLWFVLTFKMGIAGVAWATFAAQGVSSVLAMTTLLIKLKKLNFEGEFKYFDKEILLRLSKIAIPSILQQSFISVGQLFVQGLANSFGSVTVAGYAAALKINTFAVMAMNTVSGALSSFVAQNVGANKHDRVTKGFKSALAMTTIFSSTIIILALIFGEQLIGFFVDSDANADVIAVGRQFLWTVVPFHLAVMLKILCDGLLRGAGYIKGFVVATFADLLLRIIFSFAFAPLLGFGAICWAYPFGWVVSMFISLFYVKSGKWKKNSLIK